MSLQQLRLLLFSLATFALFQSISDFYLLSYRDGQTRKLGAYLVAGIGAVAAYTTAAALFTSLALHSHRSLRWGVGLGAGACFFLLATVAVVYPGLGWTSRAGFFLVWLPWGGNIVMWSIIIWSPSSLPSSSFLPSSWDGEAPLLNGPATPHHWLGLRLEEDVRMRMRTPLVVYLGLTTLFLVVGLAVTEEYERGRVVLMLLLGIIVKCVWPVHMWLVGIVVEGRWGCEGVGKRVDERAKVREELMSVVDRREREEEEGMVAKTWARLLREAPARAILINHADVSLGEPIARGGGGVVRKGLLYGKVEVAAKSLYSQFMMGELEEVGRGVRRKGGALLGIKYFENTSKRYYTQADPTHSPFYLPYLTPLLL